MKHAFACLAACLLFVHSGANAGFMAELPAPGPRTANVLLEADAARERDAGLTLTRRAEWKSAIEAFTKAQDRAHCAPSLMYNLGLAHAKAGNRVSAALWYRAYLAAEPDADNAATIRDEIVRFGNETEAAASRAFDEAERLADTLTSTPPHPGGRSLRQQALESVATSAFNAGDVKRGDRLLHKIKTIPNASPLADHDRLNVLRSRRGLFPAVFARDLDRALAILGDSEVSIPAHVKAGYMVRLHVERGDAEQARKWIEPLDRDELDRLPSFYILDDDFLRLRGSSALGLLATIHTRLMAGERKEFNPRYFAHAVGAMDAALMDGEEKIARALAKEARAYYQRFDKKGKNVTAGGELHYVLVLAVLADAEAITQYVSQNVFQLGHFWTAEALFSRIALAAALTMSRRDAIATIELLARTWQEDPRLRGEAMEKEFPSAYFARYVAEGRKEKALTVLLAGQQNTKTGSFSLEDEYERALAFAAATKDVPLALALVPNVSRSDAVVHYLYRLRALAGNNTEIRREISRIETSVCQGWRPYDQDHAHEVRWRLDHARLIDPASYRDVPEEFEAAARDKPETLPNLLAVHAVVLTFGAVAARVGLDRIQVHTRYEYQGGEVELPPSRVFDLTGHIKRANGGFQLIGDKRFPTFFIELTKEAQVRLKNFTARNLNQLCGFKFKSKLIHIATIRTEIAGSIQISGLSEEDIDRLSVELAK